MSADGVFGTHTRRVRAAPPDVVDDDARDGGTIAGLAGLSLDVLTSVAEMRVESRFDAVRSRSTFKGTTTRVRAAHRTLRGLSGLTHFVRYAGQAMTFASLPF